MKPSRHFYQVVKCTGRELYSVASDDGQQTSYVTSDESFAQHLAALFTASQLSPVHLEEVMRDCFLERICSGTPGPL